jgi:hypothetical protein
MPPIDPHPIPPSIETACHGCFLYERRGVCPIARDAYGPDVAAESEQQAEELRAAVRQDATTVVGLSELVRRDAQHHRSPRVLPAASPAELPPAPDQTVSTDSRKEAVYVHVARAVR